MLSWTCFAASFVVIVFRLVVVHACSTRTTLDSFDEDLGLSQSVVAPGPCALRAVHWGQAVLLHLQSHHERTLLITTSTTAAERDNFLRACTIVPLVKDVRGCRMATNGLAKLGRAESLTGPSSSRVIPGYLPQAERLLGRCLVRTSLIGGTSCSNERVIEGNFLRQCSVRSTPLLDTRLVTTNMPLVLLLPGFERLLRAKRGWLSSEASRLDKLGHGRDLSRRVPYFRFKTNLEGRGPQKAH